jgi:Aspartyl protease
MPFREEEDVIVDEVWIDGQKVRADIDTGSNGTLKLTPEAVQRLGLEAAGTTKGKATGYRGTYSTRKGRVQSLRIGALTAADVPATFWKPGADHDGKLGRQHRQSTSHRRHRYVRRREKDPDHRKAVPIALVRSGGVGWMAFWAGTRQRQAAGAQGAGRLPEKRY